jgi:hypothetical protein
MAHTSQRCQTLTASMKNGAIKKPPSINPLPLYLSSLGKNITGNTISAAKPLSVTKRQGKKLKRRGIK